MTGRKGLVDRSLIYNVRWQTIRVSMLDSWNTTVAVVENIDELRSYLTEVYNSGNDAEYLTRCYRIINYMNAIRMGFSGQGFTGTNVDDLVLNFRIEVQKAQADIIAKIEKGFHVEPIKWEDVEKDLRSLYYDDVNMFKEIKTDLGKRRGAALKRHNTDKHRPELLMFLDLMDIVWNYHRGGNDETK